MIATTLKVFSITSVRMAVLVLQPVLRSDAPMQTCRAILTKSTGQIHPVKGTTIGFFQMPAILGQINILTHPREHHTAP